MPTLHEFCFVYVTASSKEEARRMGRVLVEERLCACVNILDKMESIYHWEGKIEESVESVMIIKTRTELFDRLEKKIKELHMSEVPCIVQIEIPAGSAPYLDWIRAETLPI